MGLKARRLKKGLSVQELSGLTGISRQGLYNWEDPSNAFDSIDARIGSVASVLDCNGKDLVEVIDVPESES